MRWRGTAEAMVKKTFEENRCIVDFDKLLKWPTVAFSGVSMGRTIGIIIREDMLILNETWVQNHWIQM